jgi:hypothetical protein
MKNIYWAFRGSDVVELLGSLPIFSLSFALSTHANDDEDGRWKMDDG